jgi:hypothetical protein
VVTLLLGVASGIAATKGSTQIGSVTSVVSSVVDQTTVVSGIVSTTPEPVNDAVPSGSGGTPAAGGGGHSAALRGPRLETTFDRLPRRLEVLLERIEMGQNVRANLRRLERALEAASPRLSARILRLVRAEARRLERGGLTRVQRPRLKRLRLVVAALTRPGGTANASGSAALPGQLGDRPGHISSGQGAPNSTSPSGSRPFTGSGAPSSSPSKAGDSGGDRDVGGFGSRFDLPPDWESGVEVSFYAALFAVLALGLIALLLAAVPPEAMPARRLRSFARTSRLALGMTGAATLIALALILLV